MRIVLLSVLVVVTANAVFADSWTTPGELPTLDDHNWEWSMPSISGNGNRLYFASDSDGIADGPKQLYYVEWLDTMWSNKIWLSDNINTPERYTFSPCIGYDDTTLYFTRDYHDTIYISYFTAGIWQIPVPLDSAINKYGAGGPAISKDGKKLYFSSDRPGGYGGLDIWCSFNNVGVWEEPENLGPGVNTSFNENSPSISGNDSDFVFYRNSGAIEDTMNIWFIKLGAIDSAICLFCGHSGPYPYFDSYWYGDPCISWDGQRIYLTYAPFNTEPANYIYVSSRVTGVTGRPENSSSKTTLSLFPNFPNPFNQFTSISYQLPVSGHVNLSVYNIAGQLVRTLANEEKTTGKYQATWNGQDNNNRKAAQGVYFCKLESGNGQLIQKIVLIK